jgi:hypothetical protein
MWQDYLRMPAPVTDELRNDHYVPRTYLRHFTQEYTEGKAKASHIPVFSRYGRSYGSQLIDTVGCEPGFYDKHEIDSLWTKAEKDWPETVQGVEAEMDTDNFAAKILNFIAFQYVRTPTHIEPIARRLQLANGQRKKVELDGKMVNAMFCDITPSKAVFDEILTEVETVRKALHRKFKWTIYGARTGEFFFTSDNPVREVSETEELIFPITCRHLARGKMRKDGEAFSFRYAMASDSKMKRFNRLSLESAKDYIFYPFDTTAVLDRIKADARPISYDPLDGGRSWGSTSKPVTPGEIERLMTVLSKERRKRSTSLDSGPA